MAKKARQVSRQVKRTYAPGNEGNLSTRSWCTTSEILFAILFGTTLIVLLTLVESCTTLPSERPRNNLEVTHRCFLAFLTFHRNDRVESNLVGFRCEKFGNDACNAKFGTARARIVPVLVAAKLIIPLLWLRGLCE